ncbi:hypothetical protein [Candidatus Clavichlamydia salmonicola]|uniref:hypothetical protein n=1 Tax=Candidatus Clavichlamydia salmonicola TaxID=469812 RepID=UPI0018911652|nr:hypothetical protein [Candidatus Clavichlamydia salmonicola]
MVQAPSGEDDVRLSEELGCLRHQFSGDPGEGRFMDEESCDSFVVQESNGVDIVRNVLLVQPLPGSIGEEVGNHSLSGSLEGVGQMVQIVIV